MIARSITIILCFVLNLFLYAQTSNKSFQFNKLDIHNGLSNNQIECIFKDSKGFMWFGTTSGLNRYDGYQFKVFRHDANDSSSINNDYVLSIEEMPDGKLLIETRDWLNIYDPETERFSHDLPNYFQQFNLPTAKVVNIQKNGNGEIYYLMENIGLYKYQPSKKKAIPVVVQGINQDRITAFSLDSKGNIWLIRNNGLIQNVDGNNGNIIYSSDAVANYSHQELLTYRLFVDAQDELWINANGNPWGIGHFEPIINKFTPINKNTAPYKLNTDLVFNILQDNHSNIWISTDHGGINIIDKKNNTVHYLLNNTDDNNSLSQNSITSAYKDNLGIIWVGTYKRGLDYYHENMIKFPLYRHQPTNPNSLGFDDVNRFSEDASGNIWIGTNGGGLIYFDRQKNIFQAFKHQANNNNSLTNDVIVSLCMDRQQKLWIGTYFGGLDCFDGKTFKHYKHDNADTNSLSDDRIYEIFEDSDNDLWIGTLSRGLDRLDRATGIFHHISVQSHQIFSNYISIIKEYKSHHLYIGTASGIEVLDKKTNRFKHYDISASPGGNNILTICLADKNRVWIGTREGLFLFNPDKKKQLHFGVNEGLPDNAIINILEDANHQLWVTTLNGISNITLDTSGSNLKLHCKNYDETDGLQGKEFNLNAGFKTTKGEMIFGGSNGFNLFVPESIVRTKYRPLVYCTDFLLFNKSIVAGEEVDGKVLLPQAISITKSITLNYNQNVLAIEFAALDYFNADKIQYQYKLENFNKDWLPTDGKTRKATFTNLDPGSYTFKIRTTSGDDVWTDSGIALNIIIRPPFWKTPLAYCLYLLLVISVLYMLRRAELNKTNKNFAIEQERRDAKQMHELDLIKIKFFTNVSHEFRTPLSLILAPVEKMMRQANEGGQKNQLHLIYRNAKRLLNMVNQLLDFRKMEEKELKLHLTHGDIVQYVSDISYFFSDVADKKNISFSFHSNVDVFFTDFDQDKIERILFNLLSNAFKFTAEKGHVAVEIDAVAIENKFFDFQIKVTDTGIGIAADKHEKIFERFFQNDVPGSMVNQGSGIGLAITKEFVKLHGGKITVQSEPDKGSSFTVHLQLVKEILVAEKAALQPVLDTPQTNTVEAAVLVAEAIDLQIDTKPMVKPQKKQSVLLVEDNEDFRFYLRENLREYFTIIEASNGKQGWQKALAAHPDLTVSDISMPEMDGIELCKKIKGDKRTNHMPVILLTALAGEEQQLKGLETGANDYMTKPFNFEILLSKIKNQLNQQQQAKATYQKQVTVNPSEVQTGSSEDKFMQEILALIEKNISEPDFSVEDMSKEMYMSRVALYKKLLQFTGKSPLEFLRQVRLKRAAQLLEKTNMTVAEVAYEVGFNNPKYFSKYFKAEYDKLPSVYAEEMRKVGEN